MHSMPWLGTLKQQLFYLLIIAWALDMERRWFRGIKTYRMKEEHIVPHNLYDNKSIWQKYEWKSIKFHKREREREHRKDGHSGNGVHSQNLHIDCFPLISSNGISLLLEKRKQVAVKTNEITLWNQWRDTHSLTRHHRSGCAKNIPRMLRAATIIATWF